MDFKEPSMTVELSDDRKFVCVRPERMAELKAAEAEYAATRALLADLLDFIGPDGPACPTNSECAQERRRMLKRVVAILADPTESQ